MLLIGYHEVYNEPDFELLKTFLDKKSMKNFRGFISFVMQNTGKNNQVKFVLHK